MGLRGIVRDILSIYIGLEIIYGFFTNDFRMFNITVAGISLFAIAIWFILERLGIFPRL